MMTRIEVRSVLGAILMMVFVVPAASGAIRRVDWVTPCETECNGQDWDHAYESLTDALTASTSGDQIWVKKGYYVADPYCTNNCQGRTFDLVDGVEVYGGFAGGEPFLRDRDVESNETFLWGDRNSNDYYDLKTCSDDYDCNGYGNLCVDGFCIISGNKQDNSYTIVKADGVGPGTLLDGFTITGAASPYSTDGAGIDITGGTTGLQIRDCRILNNTGVRGGGVRVDDDSEVALVRCKIAQNYASSEGGGVYAGAASGTVTTSLHVVGSQVVQNRSDFGGGLWVGGFTGVIQSTLIAGNGAYGGGAIQAGEEGGITMTGSTVANNKSNSSAEAIELGSQTSTITNSVIWGNDTGLYPTQIYMASDTVLTIDYSDVEDGRDGIDNPDETGLTWGDDAIGDDIDDDPRFAEPEVMDFRVKSYSPLIDQGSNSAMPDDTYDLDDDGATLEKISLDAGLRKRQSDDPAILPDASYPNKPVDMGAFEFPCESLYAPTSPSTGEESYATNRYLPIQIGNAGKTFAVRLRVITNGYSSALEGTDWWLGDPIGIYEGSGSGSGGTDLWVAPLQCEPNSRSDWSTYGGGLIFVYGEAIMPSMSGTDSTYKIENVATACAVPGLEGATSSVDYSGSLFGDITSCTGVDCTLPPDGTADMDDIAAMVDKFKNIPGAISKVRADIAPRIPDFMVDFADIAVAVDAIRYLDYSCGAPNPCGQ